jgi:hypothetical protein
VWCKKLPAALADVQQGVDKGITLKNHATTNNSIMSAVPGAMATHVNS